MTINLVEANDQSVCLTECPPGLFLFDGVLCFKSEHKTAYTVWGGIIDSALWDGLLVNPLAIVSDYGAAHLRAENERLRVALEFYADKATYRESSPTFGAFNGVTAIDEDEGCIARVALGRFARDEDSGIEGICPEDKGYQSPP